MDLKDVKFGDLPQVKNFIQIASKIGQNNYPELLGNMYIVNAPMFFSGIYKIVISFFD